MSIFLLISGAPFWVWPLFGYLLFIGYISAYRRVVWVPLFFILPVVFLGIKMMSIAKVESDLQLFFLTSFLLGGLIGTLLAMKESIVIYKETYEVEVPGNWYTLFLLLLLFVTKFGLGVATAVKWQYLALLIRIETGVYGGVVGLFAGKAFCYVKRFFEGE